MTSLSSPANLAAWERGLMRPIGLIVLAAGAAVGGYVAWRWTTRNMYYRSLHSSIRPPHVMEEDYEQWVIRRRKRWRVVKAAIGAVFGVAVAGVLFVMIDSGLARR